MALIYDSSHSGQEIDAAVDAVQTTIPSQLTQIGSKLGDLDNLQTTEKSNLVGAINEVKSATNTNATNVSNLQGQVASINSLLDNFTVSGGEEGSETIEEIEAIGEYDNLGCVTQMYYTSDYSSKVYLLDPDKEIYYIGNGAIENAHYAAICILEDNTFVNVNIKDLVSLYPPDYLVNINSTIGRLESLTFKNLYYKNDLTKPLYLVVNSRYGTRVFDPKVYSKTVIPASRAIIRTTDNADFDNYDYIKNRACILSNENIYERGTILEGKGITNNTLGEIFIDKRYTSKAIPVEFGSYYTVSNYLDLTIGARNFSFLVRFGNVTRELKVSDFTQDSEWINSDMFFTKTRTYIYRNFVPVDTTTFSFQIPNKSDLVQEPTEILLFMNIRYIESNLSSNVYINEGTEPVQPRLEKVFGYNIGNSGTEDNNPLKGKHIAFFGDSITVGYPSDDGGYVTKVKDKLSLAEAYNYGVNGLATGGLVDMITGMQIRSSSSTYPPKDYNLFNAVTIQIGANCVVSGDITNDIPDISIYDIDSYPYQYEAEGKTISSATLNDANDFFKLCFPNTFYGNLALCIEYIRWKNPNCRIFLITIPPSERGNHLPVRDAITEIGRKISVKVIHAQENAELGLWNIKYWTSDTNHPYTHLNENGNELWASYIANELKNRFYISDIQQ